ncbi:calcium-binding and coiled-coil domain-containing protein 2 [Erethizon dorsatum]
MEKAEEEPPSAAVPLDHASFSQVIFNSVDKFYVPGGDVTCYYVFTQQFTPRRKDWIGIFRVGWKTTREYYTFMWVALPSDSSTNATKQQEVQFKAYYLPKDDEYYQFCYVDQDGVVRGASVPFQFRPESEEDILVVTTKVKVEETEQHNKELHQENQELKARCTRLEEQNSVAQAELQRKQEELETLQSINKKLEQEAEEQKARWDGERLQLKEQNQKMRSENEQLGTRVAELQREQQQKLEQAVEEMKLRETAALKTQADLMARLTLFLKTPGHLPGSPCLVAVLLRPLTMRPACLTLQEPRREKAAVEAQLVREVARLKAQVEAGKACFLEKYKECRRLHRQIRQLRAAARVGDSDSRDQESRGVKACVAEAQPRRCVALCGRETYLLTEREGTPRGGGAGAEEPAGAGGDGEPGARGQRWHRNENLDLSRRLGENQLLYDCLRGEKEQMERENDHLRKENSRLLNYMGLDFDPLPHQVPASDQEGAGQKPGLVYGNPYSAHCQEMPRAVPGAAAGTEPQSDVSNL